MEMKKKKKRHKFKYKIRFNPTTNSGTILVSESA